MQQPRVLDKVLAECVIGHDPRQPSPGLRQLVAGRDLGGLAGAAERHEVTGWVYHNLRALPDVDPLALEALRAQTRLGMAAHLRALGDLAHVRAILEPARLSWLVVRGPVLAEVVYRHPELRIYDTFDLVVPRAAFPRAIALLDQAAVQPMLAAWRRILQETEGEILLVLRYGTTVRLRCHLFRGASDEDPPIMPTEDVFARARTVSLNGVPAATLDEPDTLINLAVLAATEGKGRLGWLKDIEQAIAGEGPLWETVVERAHAQGVAEPVGAALRAARALVAARVPDDALRALESGRPGRRRAAPLASPARESARTSAGTALLRLLHLERPPVNHLDASTWHAVLQLAMRERVGPLLFEALPAPGAGHVPESVRAILDHAYRQAERDARGAYHELAGILAAVRARGLEAVVLKGAAMARDTYKDPARRPFTDLDLLVRIEDVDAVHEALSERGYAIAGGAPTAADRAWRHGRGYYDPRGQHLPVDVHWRYFGYPNLLRLDYAGVFSSARETAFDGVPGLIPSAGHLVVATSIYFLRELWYGKAKLRYLRDVAEVVHRHAVDWDQVLRATREEPLVRSPLYLALGAAARLLGARVPAEVEDALRPRRWPRAAESLRARVFRNLLTREHPFEALLQVALMRWLDGDSLAGHARWVKGLIIVPRPLAPSQRRWLRRLS